MNASANPGRLPVALITYVGWVLLTLFGMRWASDGTKKPLLETITHGISWNITMAIGLLALATLAMRPGGHLKFLHRWPGQTPPPGTAGRIGL